MFPLLSTLRSAVVKKSLDASSAVHEGGASRAGEPRRSIARPWEGANCPKYPPFWENPLGCRRKILNSPTRGSSETD